MIVDGPDMFILDIVGVDFKRMRLLQKLQETMRFILVHVLGN